MAIESYIAFQGWFDGFAMLRMQRNRLGIRHVLGHPNSSERDLILRVAGRTLHFVPPGFLTIGRRRLAILPCPTSWSKMEVAALRVTDLWAAHFVSSCRGILCIYFLGPNTDFNTAPHEQKVLEAG